MPPELRWNGRMWIWWKDRALTESDPERGLTALFALARVGGPKAQRPLLNALEKFPYARSLNEQQELLKLRVLEVCFARQGPPDNGLSVKSP